MGKATESRADDLQAALDAEDWVAIRDGLDDALPVVRAAQELAGYTRAHLYGVADATPELKWALEHYNEALAAFEEGGT